MQPVYQACTIKYVHPHRSYLLTVAQALASSSKPCSSTQSSGPVIIMSHHNSACQHSRQGGLATSSREDDDGMLHRSHIWVGQSTTISALSF